MLVTSLKMKIFSLIFFLLFIGDAVGQKDFDTIRIYFSSGFHNEAVDFSINEVKVLSREFMASNPIYGLTGGPILLCGKKYTYTITCASYQCANSKIRIRKKISATMTWKDQTYTWSFDKSKGNYFVIYYDGGKKEMRMQQYLKQPGFD